MYCSIYEQTTFRPFNRFESRHIRLLSYTTGQPSILYRGDLWQWLVLLLCISIVSLTLITAVLSLLRILILSSLSTVQLQGLALLRWRG